MTSAEYKVESAPSLDWRCAAPALLAGLGWFAFNAWHDLGWQWELPVLLILLFAACILQKRVVLELSTGSLSEQTRLIGRQWVSRHTLPLSEFTAVVYRAHRADWARYKGDYPYCDVGLRHHSGRHFWLRRFLDCRDGLPGRQAEEFAGRISSDTGIAMDEHIYRGGAITN